MGKNVSKPRTPRPSGSKTPSPRGLCQNVSTSSGDDGFEHVITGGAFGSNFRPLPSALPHCPAPAQQPSHNTA